MRHVAVVLGLVLAGVAVSSALAAAGPRPAAESWFTSYLGQRFGSLGQPYIHCENFFENDNGDQTGDCWAHFKASARWHTVIAGAVVSQSDGTVALAGTPFHRSWVRRFRRAGRRCMKQTVDPLALKGRLVSNDGTCDARLAIEIDHGKTFLHGTGTGSFTPVALYRCHQHGRTQSCANAVGDRFRYTFPRLLECGSNTGYGWTMRKASGAGKRNLTTRRVQCTPARFFVDNMKYGRPFRKGVRWTARTRYWGTYRCSYLDIGYEYADIRCTASRGRVLRWQEGA